MKIEFRNITSQYIRECFMKAYEGFPEVHSHPLIVRQQPMKVTTMQAQPVASLSFFSKKNRKYIIRLNDNLHLKDQIRVHELPEDVLVGWFAHELGHIIDYLPRTAGNLLKFGIGYLIFPNFRIGAERKADIYAIARGFSAPIIATKKYILEKSNLPDRYKTRIERYYMSADEVAIMVQKREKEHLRMDKLI